MGIEELLLAGSGIWPKYGVGIEKTLALVGIRDLTTSGKRDSPKFGRGMRDFFLPVCREFITSQRSVLADWNQASDKTKSGVPFPFTSFMVIFL